jgi:hypothetical protein
MKSKYYTPEIEEFCIGFEYEVLEKAVPYDPNVMYLIPPLEIDTWFKFTFPDPYVGWNAPKILQREVRVKYLDKEDIESLGFTDKDLNVPTKFSFYKKADNNIVYEIKTYWDMDGTKRENLIRIFKGTLHNYPYTEIFRGNIKNKSELIKLLKQLEIV